MHVCMFVPVHACVQPSDSAQVREWKPNCGCLRVSLWEFAASASLLQYVLLTGERFEIVPPALTFQPQHASPAMCDISPGVGVMANRGPDSQERRPWWQQSNNTVTSHNATMLQNYTFLRLPSDSLLSLPFLLSSLHPQLSNSERHISRAFLHSPTCAFASLSKTD